MFSTVLLTSLTVRWRKTIVRPGNFQMDEVSQVLTAVVLGSEDLTFMILQQNYLSESKINK